MIGKPNLIRNLFWSAICLWSMLLSHGVNAQTERFPANVSPIVNAPYSLFLEDYTDPGKNQLTANIVFNDFNEASWTFKLRLTIESSDIRLTTREGFTPTQPITVQPGILTQFTSTDWMEYFDFNNLEISGSGTNLVRQKGQLPEGLYSFCIEVLDYETGDALSRETCSSIWIQLNDPPRVISPMCGAVVDPKLTSFPITWQLFNTQSPNATMGTTYDLTIWQLTDPTADPLVAVPNGQALQVFQTTNLSSTTFTYGPSEPLLDLGKTYVYQIRAVSPDGRDSYKNGGRSEFCYFSYGWPEGGSLELAWPEYDGGFRSEEQPYLSWRAPNNKQPNQAIEYLIEVVEMDEGQSPDEAYAANEPWFAYRQPPTYNGFGGSINLPNLKKSYKYAWKISAYTGEQLIAESSVGVMNGPSLVEYFYAGNHRVNVDFINGKDVSNISGGGAVRVTTRIDEWTNFTFENISLIDNGGFWVLQSGEIEIGISETRDINLNARVEDNQEATFEIQKYRLTREGLDAYGKFLWDLPFATLSSEKPVVKSVDQWANFNNFRINTVIGLPENANRFDLLEPYDFTLDLYRSSLIYINDDTYRFELDGDMFVPDVVRRLEDERASFRFDNAIDLFYISGSSPSFLNAIQPIQNTQYWLRASNYIIDLSEKESPGIHTNDLAWKGIDIIDYSLTYDKSPDHKGQLNFDTPFANSYTQDDLNRYAYLDEAGVSLKLNTTYQDISDGLKFQTFPSNPLELELTIQDNVVDENSKLTGDFLIPFISMENRFGYEIPINNLGFEKGFLLDLEGYDFYFNKGALEQEIYVKINRAVLSGNERITMNVDLDWPGMGVELTGLRDFKIWGDYSVGFSAKNGTVALEERKNALMSAQEYPVTIDVIGAGSFNGRYFLATTADIVLGEDVSGPEAEPTVNVYSSVENPFVPESAQGGISDLPDEGPTYEESIAELESEIEQYEESLLAKLNEGSQQLQEEAESYKQSLAGDYQMFPPDDIVKNTLDSAALGVRKDKLYPVVEGFVTVLAEHYLAPLDKTVSDFNGKIEGAIEGEKDKAKNFINRSVDNLVDQVTKNLANTLQNNQVDVTPIINEIGIATKQAIKNEINGSLDQAVQNNLTEPIKVLLIDQFTQRVYAYLIENSTDAIYSTLKGEADGGQIAKNYANGLGELAAETTKDVANFISPENLASTVEGLASDFVQGIDMGAVASEISGKAKNIILKSLEQLAKDKAADLAQEYLEEASLPPFLGGENPIDFAGIGSKLADGNYAGAIKDALAVDPLPLKLRTPIVDLDGFVEYTPNDPDYGNVWSGDIEMKVKVPKPFVLNATYINGLIEDNSYWFVEIRGNDDEGEGGDKPYKLGDPIPREVKPLKKPVNMGIANLVGVSGRLYHHMAETDNGGIIPDPDMRFGAFMNVVFFDKKGGNNLRLAVAGEINTKANGDYTLEFDGDIQIRNKTPDVVSIDENAAIQGTVEIKYNSAEKHFFGYAKVILNEPGTLCAEGSILVDVKPGQWRVALGSRDDRLKFVPGCVGWSPTGWLDVNQNEAELGLGVQWSVSASTPTIPVILWKVKFAAEAGFAFGILAAVQYNPDLALARLGIWVDVWARLVMRYKKIIGIRPKWKTKTLIDISLSGDMILYFIPKPTTLEGSLRGRVKILFFSKSINASFSKEI